MRTIEGLTAWVKSQPKDRVIVHRSWHTCAVGDYWHDDLPIEQRDANSWVEISEWMEKKANNWWIKIGCQAGVATYGDLAKYMKSVQAIPQKGRR